MKFVQDCGVCCTNFSAVWFCAGLGRLLHKLHSRDGFCAGLRRLLHKLHIRDGFCAGLGRLLHKAGEVYGRSV